MPIIVKGYLMLLRNYATYNITENMTSSNVGNVFGGVNIDPEKDNPISGLRLLLIQKEIIILIYMIYGLIMLIHKIIILLYHL